MISKNDLVKIHQHQCEDCGRFTLIKEDDKSDLDFDIFKCSFCGGNTEHVRTFWMRVEGVKDEY